MFKFIHTADVHLDSPLRGLDRYESAPVDRIRNASRRAFENLIELAIKQQVSFVIIAGDLFDGNWRDFDTGLFFIKQMIKLKNENIKVFIVRGNHDAQSKLTKHLQYPENVHVFSADNPETICIDELSVAIHGQSFKTELVTNDLSVNYPQGKQRYINIGILHTCVDGREGHARYAPCNIDVLISKEYDYWALGHVHKREILHKNPWIVFPGNIQGRHIRETGTKGCELVVVEDNQIVSVESQALDIMRWKTAEIDLSGLRSLEEVYEKFDSDLNAILVQAEGRLLAIRVNLNGQCKVHEAIMMQTEAFKQELYARSLDIGFDDIWLERICIKTSSEIDINLLASRHDPVGNLVQILLSYQKEGADLADFTSSLEDLKLKLSSDFTQGYEGINIDDPLYVKNMLNEAANRLLPRLLNAHDDE
jgi:exonuclease SbcD